MHQKLQGFLSDDADDLKELTRKLYWAVSSTIPLTKELKASTFSWAADLADKILKRASATPPPAIRINGRQIAYQRKKVYADLAGGGVAGRLDAGGPQPQPPNTRSRATPPTSQRSGISVAEYEKFKDRQARMKAAAIIYMRDGATRVAIN